MNKEHINTAWHEGLADEELMSSLEKISDYIRRDAFELIRTANSGHVGGSSSSVEMLVAMYFGGRFNFDLEDDKNPNRDQILIRGHEGPVRYPIFALLGYLNREELSTYRHLGSRLQGHECMEWTPGVDISPSGSLGMLLSYGVGAAIVNKNEGYSGRIITFLGDGEEQEGNVSEAARHAASLGLDNLICILDQNKKQLTRSTAEGDGESDIRKIWEGYGWEVLEIENGHDIKEIIKTYDKVQNISKPTIIIAHTTKGKGVRGAEEHFSGYHTLKVTDRDALDEAISDLNEKLSPDENITIQESAKNLVGPAEKGHRITGYSDIEYDVEYDGTDTISITDARDMYFDRVHSRMTDKTAPLYMISPDHVRTDVQKRLNYDEFTHFYNIGIREQHAIGMAHGIATTQPEAKILVHFWDFTTYRALDQINAAAQAGSSIVINGVDAGIYHGNNGRTHISTGQPGALLSIPEVSMYEPADAQDLFSVYSYVFTCRSGLSYVRLHSGAVDKLERDSGDEKNIGSYITYRPDKPAKLVIFSSSSFVKNAVEAAKLLETQYKTPVEVVNVVNPKKIGEMASKVFHDGLPILTLYNGNPAILQSFVAMAAMQSNVEKPRFIIGHGITEGTSGLLKELEKYYNLDANGIAMIALKALVDRRMR